MDVATQQAGQPGQDEQELKLKIDKFSDGGMICLKFSGTVDEDFDGKKLAATVRAQTLILDLADIKKISSFGIREWVDFISAIEKNVQKVILLECAPKVVDQLNMVANFAGDKGQVFSFYAPYRCDYCDSDSSVLMQIDNDWEIIKTMKPPERPCGACGEPEYFDEDPTTYFSFIAGQEQFELDHEVAAFLSSKLNYTVSEAARRLRIDKIIEGRSTYLKLAGDLDGSFPREKLAEGLEGTVIIDLAGMGKIDPAGAAEWRGFLQMITPAAESIFLLGVPPGFLEKLTKPEDLGPKAQVITFAMPYSCAKCATTASQLVDVEQHYDVLKFATPPEMKCTDCKSATTCAATEGLLSHLPTLPKPSISPQTRKFIKEVRERKPEKKKTATTVAEAAAQGRGGGMGMMIGAGLLAASLAVGAIFVWNYMQEQKKGDAELGAITVGDEVRSAPGEMPSWIAEGVPFFSSSCAAEGEGLACVGISSYLSVKQDADSEAKQAAQEAIVNAVGLRVDNKDWQNVVLSLYGEARAARVKEFDRLRSDALAGKYDKNEYRNAHREVFNAQNAVAKSFENTGGARLMADAQTATYWQEFEDSAGTGTRFLVYHRFVLDKTQLERLVDHYSKGTTALGATVVTYFPGVAWRYRQVSQGAIVISLGEGKLRDHGLATESIILSVGGREVSDAASFEKHIKTEVDVLKDRGGNLALKLKSGMTTDRFNIPFKGKKKAGGPTIRRGGPRKGPRQGPTQLPVPWKSGRDDPTQ